MMRDVNPDDLLLTRRSVVKNTARVAAASTLITSIGSSAWAAGSDTIQAVLVGCGGRGTGAADQAMTSSNGPVKVVAMADVFPHKMETSHKALSKKHKKESFDVAADRMFIGFDAYAKAMDLLKPGDIAIMATPLAFRWVQFQHAIKRGLNVFMEKPLTADGPTSRRMLKLAEEASAKNLKCAVGLMCRHCAARRELYDRIKSGAIGDITLLRAYRQAGPTGSAFAKPRGAEKFTSEMSEVMYQISNFHAFLWASGGGFSDFLIHNIDESCWMKDAWPVQAKASGGRHYRGDYVDQNFDNYSVEYTFEDGAKLHLEGRTMSGCAQEFASYAHGTKGSAVISTAAHHPAKSRIYASHRINKDTPTWQYGPNKEPNPYQEEWDHLLEAIRQNKPYNEIPRGVQASLVTSMGRMSAHTGRIITYEEMLNSDHEFAPQVDKMTMDGPAPVVADASGRYPVPAPGVNTKREY